MADNNYLNVDTNGRLKENLSIKTTTGASDSGKIIQTDSEGRIDESFFPGAEEVQKTASEALEAGDIVNFWDDAGAAKMRKADASGDKPAHGFVLTSVDVDTEGTAYTEGVITGLSSLTPGKTQFLAETAGEITETPVTTSGNLLQRVGVAESATSVSFERGEPITRA